MTDFAKTPKMDPQAAEAAFEAHMRANMATAKTPMDRLTIELALDMGRIAFRWSFRPDVRALASADRIECMAKALASIGAQPVAAVPQDLRGTALALMTIAFDSFMRHALNEFASGDIAPLIVAVPRQQA